MTARDLREVVIRAAITAVVVIAVFGSRMAMSEGPENQGPQVTVDGCRVTATAAAAKDPYWVELTVCAENPTAERRKLDLNLFVIRSEFTGDPLSRVIIDKDNKLTKERDIRVKLDVPASDKAEKKVTIPIDARPAKDKEFVQNLSAPLPKSVGTDPNVTMTFEVLPAANAESARVKTLTLPPTYIIATDAEGKNMVTTFAAFTAWPKK